MEKKNIFKKIDELYTKSIDKSDPNSKVNILTNTFCSVKSKILNLGKLDEKTYLYKEVIKREKEEEKIAKQKLKEAKKEIMAKKAAAKKAAKTVEKKKPTTKTTSRKKVAKKESEAIKKTQTKKKTSEKSTSKPTKTTATKKVVKKESSSSSKTQAKKKTSQETTSKPTKTTTKKAATTISKKDAKIALYAKDIEKYYGEVDMNLLKLIVKNLGPSIYRKNAEIVSCSEQKELDTVRRNFLIKKLAIDASKNVLDAAIEDVCKELKSAKNKYRATFYYSLTKKFKKESVLN